MRRQNELTFSLGSSDRDHRGGELRYMLTVAAALVIAACATAFFLGV